MKQCKNCGVDFEPKTKVNIFCCRDCKNKFHNKENKFHNKENKRRYNISSKEGIKLLANNIKHLITQEKGEVKIKIDNEYYIIDKKYEKAFNELKFYIKKGYAKIKIQSRPSLHRLIWFLEYNSYPELYLDHIDRDKKNNKISNLRLVNCSQNSSNSTKRKSKKNSKYKGVHRTANGKYQAMVWYDGKNHAVGSFPTEEEAALAYNQKAKEIFGNYAYQNNI